MKAVQYSQYGEPDVLSINELDKPVPQLGQVLVEVKAAALNPFDWKLRKGYMKDMIPLQLPITIGADFAGIVTELGEDAGDIKVGDEVFGSAIMLNGGSGALAEYAVANVANISVKPANVSFEEAAASVLVGVSSIQALDQLDVSEGSRVLIHGGAGGIGSTAIQYAKHLGAYVTTAVKAKDFDFVKNLGADEVVDYESQQFDEVLKDLDAVYDTIGGDTYTRSFKVLKQGGKIISMNEQPNEDLANEHGATALYLSTNVSSESLAQLKNVIERDVIKPKIDQSFPLEQTAQAFEHLEQEHPQGKVVIKVN